MSKYTINVSFQTRVNKTTRTLEIAESFGLGLDEKEWTLYDNLELEVKQGDVVYITGQSGSGKSVVLRELQRQMKDEGLSVASIDDFTFDNEVNVIDQLGKTTSEALGLLSMAGLNDAYLFVRKPSEMSDGQKYRLKIAKLIESGAKVWAADEFGAVLDEPPACRPKGWRDGNGGDDPRRPEERAAPGYADHQALQRTREGGICLI